MAAVARIISRLAVVASLVGAGLVLSGCGKSGSTTVPASEARFSEAEVDRLAGLRRNSDLTYRLAAHPTCLADSLLRSGQEVQTYKKAGDVVATNPDKTVGVKITGQSEPCQRLFAAAMARVR
jgi:hypothetical protein